MGKNKLKKFAEMETLDCVYQYPFATLRDGGGCPLCGKGEYAVGMGRLYPDRNFIGIDIKGARMWTGARQVADEGLGNVAFLRTSIHLLPEFFAPGEVSEIWITFPDPQMKKVNKRLTGTHFMEIYRRVLVDGGAVRLKTDSPFLAHNSLPLLAATDDLYNSPLSAEVPPITTYYEQQWLGRGIPSKYIAWQLPASTPLTEPDIEIEPDTYRSFGRGTLQGF